MTAMIKEQNKRMELLAPAGSWETLMAALAGGADAVYLGGKTFSARQYANNFDLPQLEKAVRLLHLHRRKLFVTVNTLISDAEMDDALEFIRVLYNMGVDAIIVQDLGLIHQVRQWIPNFPIHASTQMTIHNLEGARYLADIGVQRAVLARELTADEIAVISEQAGLESEVFVHGALCVCYSGQCLMSSMIGGRSGNRGRCAQPCRLEYQLIKNETPARSVGNHLLSPKDLALLPMIPELNRAGVRSLKIEGRMKGPEYVYSVVKVYREALERFDADPEFRVTDQDLKKINEVFNRGFTTGYFGGNRNVEIMSFARPNNRGLQVGRVISSDWARKLVTVRLESELELGDMVEAWVSQGGRATAAIQELITDGGKAVIAAAPGAIVRFGLDGKVQPGDRIFKVVSARVSQEVKQAIDETGEGLRIPCTVEVWGQTGSALNVIYRDDQGNCGVARTEVPLQPARNRPLSTEMLREQLGRLGNTPFYLTDIQNNLPESPLMVPISELNQARRDAIEKLADARLQSFDRVQVQQPIPCRRIRYSAPATAEDQYLLSVWVADTIGVKEAASRGADLIYIGGDELTGFHWTTAAIQEAALIAHAHGARLIFGLPRIVRQSQQPQIEAQLESVAAQADGIMVSDLGSYRTALMQTDRRLFINYPLNIFNQNSIEVFNNPRVEQVCVSPELTLSQIKQFSNFRDSSRLECLVQGPMELMISEYCPIASISGECGHSCHDDRYYLRDRLNMNFPIRMDQFCRMHLLNCNDLCLIGDLSKLKNLSAAVFRLELKTLPGREVGTSVAAYHNALEQGLDTEQAERMIDIFKKITGRGITKGHYFRGVE
jgi:putative protease